MSDCIRIMVGLPAYNEEKYVGSMVLQVRQHAAEVVVVDDGSRDRTGRVAELAGAVVVRHGQNKGYGSAIRSILSEAKKRNADVLVILDADCQHNPDEIPLLVRAVTGGADVVIGSREMRDNAIPTFRRTGQRVLARMTGIASGRKMSDTESGFRAYSRKAIVELELKETGMAISSEIVSAAARQGLKLAEVPISVTYAGDTSTLNPVSHGVGVLSRILVMISERRPLLFFSATGAICIVLGAVMGVMVVLTLRAAQVMQVGTALLSMLFITVGALSIFTGLILNVLIKRIGESGKKSG